VFKVPGITRDWRLLKFTVLESFGAGKTYLNQVLIFSGNPYEVYQE